MMSGGNPRLPRHAGTGTVKVSTKVIVTRLPRRVIDVDNPLNNCYNETVNEQPNERYEDEIV